MSVIKFCDTDAAGELDVVAGILEVGSDWVKFPPLRTTGDGLSVRLAVEIIVQGGILRQGDLGKLLSYVSDVLGDRGNYVE